MPTEIRRIILSMGELQEALKQFVDSRPTMFGDACMTEGRLVKDDPVEVEVSVQVHPQSTNPSTYTLGGPHLAAALIAYCQHLGIPLSRSASKAVRRVKTGVALDMTIETKRG